MRVLFYGGCHSTVLRALFARHAAAEHEFEAIENYKIIAAGEPFPYERAATFDAVVYSPIRNKDDWNTSLLAERLPSTVKLLSFPRLQWNGYFTNVKKMAPNLPPHTW